MSKIKNGGLDQYGTEPFEQQQFGTAGVEGVNPALCKLIHSTVVKNLIRLIDERAFCIVSRCDRYICTGGEITELTDDVRSTLQMDVVDKMAGQGLRTIGVAYRELTPGIQSNRCHAIISLCLK